MERERGSNGLMFSIVCFTLGFNIANFAHIATDDAEERVRDIQVHNEQLYEQLSETYEDIGSLALDDEEDSFTFTVTQGNDPEQTCEGEYKVNNNVAVAIGDIACSISTPINVTTTTIG